jgi:hypothetical protein
MLLAVVSVRDLGEGQVFVFGITRKAPAQLKLPLPR